MWACYPMGRCHIGLRNGSIYENFLERRVRGTALGLLAVPTKLGNPGGWEYRRVLLYSHLGAENFEAGNSFWGKLFSTVSFSKL